MIYLEWSELSLCEPQHGVTRVFVTQLLCNSLIGAPTQHGFPKAVFFVKTFNTNSPRKVAECMIKS